MRARRPAAVFLFVALIATLTSAVELSTPNPASAQTGFEQITSYGSDVTIEADGAILVQETIAYDFGVVPRHGIFRVIPVRTEQSGKDG
ncbi:MAG: DUF2207 domain-containing protein, partial [Acidimicrobiia bacterium]